MVKTWQGWVRLSPLELLAVEAVGGATLAVGGVASAVGGVASASVMGGEALAAAAAVTVGASSVSVVLVSEMEVVASAAMAFAVPEVGYPVVADATRMRGDLTETIQASEGPQDWVDVKGTFTGDIKNGRLLLVQDGNEEKFLLLE
eukprot:g27840.t1